MLHQALGANFRVQMTFNNNHYNDALLNITLILSDVCAGDTALYFKRDQNSDL